MMTLLRLIVFAFYLSVGHVQATECVSDNVLRSITTTRATHFAQLFLTTEGVNTTTLVTTTYLKVYPTSRI
jgi:hypothetical protein